VQKVLVGRPFVQEIWDQSDRVGAVSSIMLHNALRALWSISCMRFVRSDDVDVWPQRTIFELSANSCSVLV